MKTNATETGPARVRIEVEIDPEEVDRRLERTASALGGELRIPGFRKGKVPPAMVLQRVGREAVMQRALEEALPEWYERALLDSAVRPVGEPKLELESLPGEGEPLGFAIDVSVRPKAELGDYKGLEVGRREPEVPEEAVQAELDRLREGFGSLETVDRAAGGRDIVLIDYRGAIDGEPFEGGEARDYLLELGGGTVVEDFEKGLAGAKGGEDRDVKVTFPDDYRPEELAGKTADFNISVKEVKEKRLPDLDDDFASDASELDTLEELREDIRGRIRHAVEHEVEDEFRRAAVDAAVDKAKVDVPDDVLDARAEELWSNLGRSLERQGVTIDRYLEVTGQDKEKMLAEARESAARELRREAVLEAVADAESIEVSDEEMTEALAPAAEREGTSAEKLLEALRSSGRDALLVNDLRLSKAADAVTEAAKPIAAERAEARERIWTPEKEEQEEQEEKPGLWTPGS